MDNNFEMIDQYLEKFANQQPAKGTHLSYLEKATNLMSLYGDALFLMDGERSSEAEARVAAIAEEIKNVVS